MSTNFGNESDDDELPEIVFRPSLSKNRINNSNNMKVRTSKQSVHEISDSSESEDEKSKPVTSNIESWQSNKDPFQIDDVDDDYLLEMKYQSTISSTVSREPSSDYKKNETYSSLNHRSMPDSSVGLSNRENYTVLSKVCPTKHSDAVSDTKSKAQLKKEEREAMKLQKQLEREANQRLKEEKRAEKERINAEKRQQKEQEKLIKRTLQETRKNAKPKECVKLINVSLDPGIAEGPGGASILMALQQLEVRYFIEQQRVKNMITWTREVTDLVQNENNQLVSQTTEEAQDDVLVAIGLEDFLNMVNASQSDPLVSSSSVSLKSFVEQHKVQLPAKTVTFYVSGFEKHLRDQKNLQKRKQNDQARNKRMRTMNDVVSRLDAEQALMEVQLCTDCNVRFVETPDETAKLVMQFTKAIAEAPFKQERLKTGFSFHVDGGGSVKVDKDGVGLTRVWRQQIQQFKNVSAEMANTILAQYPSPRSLYSAYQRCTTEKEAALLLQDLVVRRGAGVTETTRRIGKELSQKIHQLLTSQDPCTVIK